MARTMATTSNAAMRKKTPFHVALFRKQATRSLQRAVLYISFT
jgi:hypothetical protein